MIRFSTDTTVLWEDEHVDDIDDEYNSNEIHPQKTKKVQFSEPNIKKPKQISSKKEPLKSNDTFIKKTKNVTFQISKTSETTKPTPSISRTKEHSQKQETNITAAKTKKESFVSEPTIKAQNKTDQIQHTIELKKPQKTKKSLFSVATSKLEKKQQQQQQQKQQKSSTRSYFILIFLSLLFFDEKLTQIIFHFFSVPFLEKNTKSKLSAKQSQLTPNTELKSKTILSKREIEIEKTDYSK